MSETRKIAAILVSDVVGYSRLAGRGRRSNSGAAPGAPQRSDRSHNLRAPWPHRQAHRRWQHHRVPQRRRRGASRARSAARYGRAQRRGRGSTSASSFASAFIWATSSRRATATLWATASTSRRALESVCQAGRHLPLRGRLSPGKSGGSISRSPISARSSSRTLPSRCGVYSLESASPRRRSL